MAYRSDHQQALMEYRAAVRVLPDGWRMTDKLPNSPDAVRSVAELLQLMGQPVPSHWCKADAERVLDLIVEFLTRAADEELAEVGKTFSARQAQSLAAAATAAKRRAALSPLQRNVQAMERQLGPGATDRAIVGALALRGLDYAPATVHKARKALRQKGL